MKSTQGLKMRRGRGRAVALETDENQIQCGRLERVLDLCLVLLVVRKSGSLFQYQALAEARVTVGTTLSVAFYWMVLWT